MRVIQQAEQALRFRVEPRRYVYESLGQLAVASSGTPVEVMAAASNAQESRRGGLLGRVFSGWGRKG
jgi:hypothetical protein